MTTNEARLKAELLRLKMEHPVLKASFIHARAALWESEERMDRIKTELRLAAQHKSTERKDDST